MEGPTSDPADEATPASAVLAAIQVVLVSPMHAGNVGACARAIKNMGLGGLSIVEPLPTRDPEAFRAEARKLAVEAGDILDATRTYETLDDLVGPATYLVATTAKKRRGLPLMRPRWVAERVIEIAQQRPVALLFGREDHGLPDRLVARANLGLQIPSATEYPVLNLAQSVMLIAYELRLQSLEPSPPAAPGAPSVEDLDALHREAADSLAAIDYLKDHNRERVFAELEGLLVRATPSAREVSMLRGICRQIRWLAARDGSGSEPP